MFFKPFHIKPSKLGCEIISLSDMRIGILIVIRLRTYQGLWRPVVVSCSFRLFILKLILPGLVSKVHAQGAVFPICLISLESSLNASHLMRSLIYQEAIILYAFTGRCFLRSVKLPPMLVQLGQVYSQGQYQ